jgi:hypothetical protein
MTKTITVFGATGVQGGGVVRALLKSPSQWKVRGVSRNIDSEKAKALTEHGVEMVSANFDDPESLTKAMDGTHAIFVTTNYWEHLFMHGNIRAGEIEYEQGVRLAQAASKCPTLEHYIWSTLPSATAATNGRVSVPHVDHKAKVDEYIKNSLPDLAKKTTFVWVAFYASNIAYYPPLIPAKLSTSSKHALIFPSPQSTVLPVAGDPSYNTGIYVHAILSHPEVSLPARYAVVQPDTMTCGEMLQLWGKVTGNDATYLQVSLEDFEALWPVLGQELGLQFQWNEAVPDWKIPGMLTDKDLGIEGQLIGTEEAFKNVRAAWE